MPEPAALTHVPQMQAYVALTVAEPKAECVELTDVLPTVVHVLPKRAAETEVLAAHRPAVETDLPAEPKAVAEMPELAVN
jgi:hypothetical protein